jgi:hypothetical protein
MIPVDFPEKNLVYTKPKGWTDEQCSDLPVWSGPVKIDEQGNTAASIISCWQLSKEDLEEVNKTGRIWLCVSSNVQPPVSIFTENPFVQPV